MDILSRLRLVAARVAEPRNYYRGHGLTSAAVPQNVLMFHRNRMPPGHERDNQHHRFMLILNLQTAGRLCLDERVINLAPEHALLVFPYQLHHYLTIDVSISWLFITFEMESSGFLSTLRNRVIKLSPIMQQVLIDLVRVDLDDQDRVVPALRLELGLAYLVAVMAEPLQGMERSLAPQEAEHPLDGRGIVERVNRYIYPRLSQALTVDQVASAVGLSPSHLRNRFRVVMGDSLGAYIRRVRINRAMSLLRDTENSVSMVADACGFASIFSFSRTFRRVAGCSPSSFRERSASRL